ncbi:MAG: sigma 54-interacting transcriptional regulator [Deltaproteobacteria bacterium]|jgi:arginine utilization regulatory protein|nr:sigma 54-interacting transcriptional regulator [Deltaproteobacteria bacterium]
MPHFYPKDIDTDLADFPESLSFSQKSLKEMFDHFPLGVIMTDTFGRVVYYNDAHSKIDGIEVDEMLGRREYEALAPINGPNVMEICQKTGQPILGYIYPYRNFKGRVVNAAYWVYPVRTGSEVKGSLCFTQPLLGEFSQARAYKNPAVQWPGLVPIRMPAPNIVGQNPEFLKAVFHVKSNSSNSFPILISGETGSGKELLAKLTHQASYRRGKPYLALNCAAIPANLLEGLLFGTTKGSFTGAIDRPGLMAEANGGTLYLDELDSMPLELQPKLLRTIQEMKAFRVGSSVPVELDLKLVVSIGSSPNEALSSGRLRPDLFYRVAVVLVNIPPLRKRLDDLGLLTDYFLNKYNNLLGKQAIKIDPALWDVMRRYSWPGNVRELEHMLAGTLAQVTDELVIGLEHVHEHYLYALSCAPIPSQEGAGPDGATPPEAFTRPGDTAGMAAEPVPRRGYPSTAEPLISRLRNEAEDLLKAIVHNRGNVALTARGLGISRQLLAYRLKKFGIDPKLYRP